MLKECEYIDQLNRTAIMNNQTFSSLSTFVKPEKLDPVDLMFNVILIFGIIPFGFYKLQTFLTNLCMSKEQKAYISKRKERRTLLRKACIAKEIGVDID